MVRKVKSLADKPGEPLGNGKWNRYLPTVTLFFHDFRIYTLWTSGGYRIGLLLNF